MGDLIQSTPLLAGLRKRHPSARITVVVSSDFLEFAKRIPHVDEIVVFNLRQFNERKEGTSLSWVEVYRYLEKFLDDLAASRFDLLVNLSHSKLSALMISYLGVKEVRGFACHETGDRKTVHPWMQYFGTEPFNRAFNTYNLVDIFARGGDVVPDGQGIKIVSEPGDGALIAETLARENIRDGDFLIGIQAGSSLEGRRWPAASFAELADLLVEKLGARILLFGVASESALAREIAADMRNKNSVLDLTGKTTIPRLIAWLTKCRYLVTNDTGTMHVAAALGTPIVGLFFAHAHPRETAPYGAGHVIFQARIPCAPCSYGVQCNNVVCIDKVRPRHVYSMISRQSEKGVWELPPDMGNLEGMNVYQTGFDKDNLLRLKPMIKRPPAPEDLVALAYRKMWLKALAGDGGEKSWKDGELEGIADTVREDYDVACMGPALQDLRSKSESFQTLRRLAERAVPVTDRIIEAFGSRSLKADRLRLWSETLTQLDDRIDETGLTHPEVKPLADMFAKRKENLAGDDVLALARTTRKYYRQTIAECALMVRALAYTADILEARSDWNLNAAPSSIKVAVPGR